MDKNILDLINDKETIGSLFEKTDTLKSENKLQNKKIENKALIISLIFYIFSYILQLFIFKEKFESINEALIILIFTSLISTAIIVLFVCSIHMMFEELFYIKNLGINTMYKKKLKNKILKFEKNLNKKELEYYNCIDFKSKISDYKSFLYDNYIIFLNKSDASLIIENKKNILNNIKEEFNEVMQKYLFEEILKIIEEKDTTPVLDKIEIATKKRNTNKTGIENE